MSDDKLTITGTSDEKYLKYLYPLVNSIAKNTTNTKLYLRLVNTTEEKGEKLYDLHPDIEILFDNVDLCTDKTLLDGDKSLISLVTEKHQGYGYLLSEQMCYCSNIKYNTINYLLSRGDRNILHMDVDAIVRHDLRELVSIIQQHDVVIRKDTTGYKFHLTSEPNGETYRQGVIGINNTPVCERLFENIEQKVRLDMNNWDADQINFYHCFESLKDEIRFFNLPISYRDTCHDHLGGDSTGGSFDDSSHIWSGSYKAKRTQSTYLDEWKKYL